MKILIARQYMWKMVFKRCQYLYAAIIKYIVHMDSVRLTAHARSVLCTHPYNQLFACECACRIHINCMEVDCNNCFCFHFKACTCLHMLGSCSCMFTKCAQCTMLECLGPIYTYIQCTCIPFQCCCICL